MPPKSDTPKKKKKKSNKKKKKDTDFRPIVWHGGYNSEGEPQFMINPDAKVELAFFVRKECMNLKIWGESNKEANQRNPEIGNLLARKMEYKRLEKKRVKKIRHGVDDTSKNNEESRITGYSFTGVQKDLRRALSTGDKTFLLE